MNKTIKKDLLKATVLFTLLSLIPCTLCFASIYGQSVDSNDLDDNRSFSSYDYSPPSSEGGMSGNYPGFSISWNVYQDTNTDLWTYEYTLTGDKEISHFILEITKPFSSTISGDPYEGPQIWSPSDPGNSNPGLPADIYGIKFDFGGSPVTYTIETPLDPVWGNFYAKDGKDSGADVFAYNNALAASGFDSDNKLDFIVRPNGVAPEPAASALFLIGGSAMVFVRKRRNKK